MLQVIQSGIPGQAIQTGFSLVPGASPFVNLLEPVIRKQVIDFLQQQQAQQAVPLPPKKKQ
jgi:hypothetical protein